MKIVATTALSVIALLLIPIAAAPAQGVALPSGTLSPASMVEQADGSTLISAGNSQLVIDVAPPNGPTIHDQVALDAVITCTLNVQYPHASTHVNGTINVVDTINCGAAAAQLELALSLIRQSPNYTQWAAGTVTGIGVASLQNNRAVGCDQGPGVFQGWGWGRIVPPPGYELSGPAEYQTYGEAVNVACGVTAVAPPEGTSETLTVTFAKSS